MSLFEAQEAKLKRICEKLKLENHDHILEIGTGWGAFACFAAKNYGVKVTTTISKEQYNYTKKLIKKEGLTDKVTSYSKTTESLKVNMINLSLLK